MEIPRKSTALVESLQQAQGDRRPVLRRQPFQRVLEVHADLAVVRRGQVAQLGVHAAAVSAAAGTLVRGVLGTRPTP
ncbi:hypothetical protein AB0B45_47265 [Nonomuraea sp. NPDC049152]|uniref:hypothetical protein n=1 Tax=Nonomuraea sp. NPDC049152 TaxID=3154350 RepID=UPI0033D1522E